MRLAWPCLIALLACEEGRVVPPPSPAADARPANDATAEADASADTDASVEADASADAGVPEDAAGPVSDASAAEDATPDASAAEDAAGPADARAALDASAPDASGPDASAPDAIAAPDASPAQGCGTGATQRVQSLRTSNGFSTTLDANDVVAHPDGSYSVIGTLAGPETFGAGTAAQLRLVGSQIGSPVVLRYDASGAFLWGKVFGTSSGSALRGGSASDGSVIFTGSFEATLIVDAGLPTEQRLSSRGGYDTFLARLGPRGDVAWVRAMGSDRFDFPEALGVAGDGASVVAGRYGDFAAPNVITFEPNRTLSSQGRWEELFVAAYDPQGNLRWARQGGSPGRDDHATDLALLPDGSAVLVGALDDGAASFEGGARPAGTLSVAQSPGYYLLKYGSGGDLEFLREATLTSSGEAVATNGAAIFVAVTGSAGSVFDPGRPSARTLGAAARAIAVYALDGTLSSLTPVMNAISIGGVRDLAVASDGTIALAGSYYSQATFYTTAGDSTRMPQGWDDAFVACMAPGASGLAWIREGRGTLQDYGNGVRFDAQGRILVAGDTRDGLDLELGNGMSGPVPIGDNGFVALIGR